jgi:hypothetical protein
VFVPFFVNEVVYELEVAPEIAVPLPLNHLYEMGAEQLFGSVCDENV